MKIYYKNGGLFWNKVKIDNKEKCWNWISRNIENGYGKWTNKDITRRSHQWAMFFSTNRFADAKNEEIVRHSCNNKLCCNPNHLKFGTHSENMEDIKNYNKQKNKI